MANVSQYVYICSDSPTAALIVSCWTAVKYSMVLPLSVFILHLAYQQWRPRLSFQGASHSDILTYHMATMELFGAGGAVLYTCGVNAIVGPLILLGAFLIMFCFPGQILIHCLTCVDRYLAVVRPVTYLKLRQATGIKIRNVGIFIIWLCCVGSVIMQALYAHGFPTIPILGLLLCASILVSFCSLSVLRVLIRPGPSEVSIDRVDKSKRKAFNTITAILVTLCLSFAGFIVCMAFTLSPETNYDDRCIVFTSGLWSNIPNCLVLPMLFLKRKGKLKFK